MLPALLLSAVPMGLGTEVFVSSAHSQMRNSVTWLSDWGRAMWPGGDGANTVVHPPHFGGLSYSCVILELAPESESLCVTMALVLRGDPGHLCYMGIKKL